MGGAYGPFPLIPNHATVKSEDLYCLFIPAMNDVEVFEKPGKPLKFHQRINLNHKRKIRR